MNASHPSTPRYQAVKAHILERIRSGAWGPGDRISSEHELVAELGLSRMTVNRALRELAEEGLLLRVAGVGSFVAEPKAQSALLAVSSLAEEIRGRGHEHRCDVLRVVRESATMEVAAALGLSTGSSVFHALCVHRENGVPVQIEDRYVNPQAAPAFADQDFRDLQPGEYLLREVPLDEVEHVVDAVASTPEEAELLGIRSGAPCLVLTRRTWTGALPVTFVRCIHPGTRYRLGTRFRVSGPQPFG